MGVSGSCCLYSFLAVPSYTWTRQNVKAIETFYNSKLSPIIMIPGSSATENRFDGLVNKLNQNRRGVPHSLLKVKVWNDGHTTYSGKIASKDNEPIIVIGFENNKDGYNNIKKQANMVNNVFLSCKTSTILIILKAWGTQMVVSSTLLLLKTILIITMLNLNAL